MGYDATDLYFGCILRAGHDEADQNIDVQDKREVKHAKWVPLSKLSHSNDLKDDTIEYHLFPVAYEFISVLIEQIKAYDNSDKQNTLIEFLKENNLAAGEELTLTEDSPKPKGYNFYQKGGRSKDY